MSLKNISLKETEENCIRHCFAICEKQIGTYKERTIRDETEQAKIRISCQKIRNIKS